MSDLEAELAALMAEDGDDDDEGAPKMKPKAKAGKKTKEEKPKEKRRGREWYDVDDDDDDDNEAALAALMAAAEEEDGGCEAEAEDDIHISDSDADVQDPDDGDDPAVAEVMAEVKKETVKPAPAPQKPSPPPPEFSYDIPDLEVPSVVQKPAPPQQQQQQQILAPSTQQTHVQAPVQHNKQQAEVQAPAQQNKQKTQVQAPTQQNKQQTQASNKPKQAQSAEKPKQPANSKQSQVTSKAQKAATQIAPKAAPKPKEPQKIINEDSNPNYDKFFYTFASSFYTFLQNSGKPESQKFRNQVDTLLPVIVAGPSKPLPPLKVHQPQPAPDTTSFADFQLKNVICAEDNAQAQKILSDVETQLKEIRSDIIHLKKLKENVEKLKPILEAFKRLTKTIELFPDYPYVIPDVLKYGIPVVNTDVPLRYIELSIEQGKNFPAKEIQVKGILTIMNLGRNETFVTEKRTGKNPNFSFRKQIALDLSKEGISLLKGQKAELYLYEGKNEIASSKFSLASIFSRATSEQELTFQEIPNATLKIILRVQKCLSSNELKIVTRPLLLSPISMFAPPKQVPKSKKPAAAPSKEPGKGEVSKNQTVPKEHEVSADQAAAKAKLRKQEKIQLPEYIILSEEEMNKFWSITVIQFFKSSTSIVLSQYRNARIAPPSGLQKMNQIAVSKEETLTADVQSGRLSMDKYVSMVQEAIKRESDIIDSYEPGKPQNEARGRIGMMVKELEDF